MLHDIVDKMNFLSTSLLVETGTLPSILVLGVQSSMCYKSIWSVKSGWVLHEQ